jgi:hypothetical protein
VAATAATGEKALAAAGWIGVPPICVSTRITGKMPVPREDGLCFSVSPWSTIRIRGVPPHRGR